MVGVPGKYKGCNTCRLRRVKCDNRRPLCRKCSDGGRECGGYERETVFIIGTIQDGGRCSSHPPRVVKSSKKGKRSPTKVSDDDDNDDNYDNYDNDDNEDNDDDKLDLLTLEPLQPAWDDVVAVSNQGAKHYLQITALHSALRHVARGGDDSSTSRTFLLHFPQYEPFTIRSGMNQGDFQLKAQCLIHLAPVQEAGRDSPGSNVITDSTCLFLYEHNWSHVFTDQAPWKESMADANTVRRLGPENFQTFPNHHFFVRLFRHNAICSALLNRKSTYLSRPEWLTTPWELHPKSRLDKLFDSMVLLPSLLSRTDRILGANPTVARRLQAQDLLGNCLHLERLFEQWHSSAYPDLNTAQSRTYWVQDPDSSHAHIPFADPFDFTDGVAALTFIYYWTSLIILHPCIEKLYDAVFQPVLDAFPQVYPTLPAALHDNALRYSPKGVRALAANVCRSLDAALAATAQPDSLLFPLLVVHDVYADIGLGAGDAHLEMMWCEAFRTRLAARGRDIADGVRSKRWCDMAQY